MEAWSVAGRAVEEKQTHGERHKMASYTEMCQEGQDEGLSLSKGAYGVAKGPNKLQYALQESGTE